MGLSDWERLLGIQWPRRDRPGSLCDQSGECCRGAAQIKPWQTTLPQAARGHQTSRDFLSQFVPYASLEAATAGAPDGVAASLAIMANRGESPDEIRFYRCRYLKGQNECQIYEDRPDLCREFPESPFGAIPACCGYAGLARACNQKLDAMREELARLKRLQQEQDQGGD